MTNSNGEGATIGSVILAGGRSLRMGRPKALIPLRGSTFLETIEHAYVAAGVPSILVVTFEELAGHPDFPRLRSAELLKLERSTESPLHTLWEALDWMEERWSAFFLHPVDHPFVLPDTIERMLRIYEARGPKIIQPRHKGRGGHPVVFDLELSLEIRGASPDQGLRQVVRADPDRVCRIEVDDEGILRGVNRPSDLIES